MAHSDSPSSIRTCAARMIRTIDAYALDHDSVKLRQGLLDAPFLCHSAQTCTNWASNGKPITSKTPSGCITTIS